MWIAGFAAFAFIWTLIREIIKDMQDEYGDREMECRTIPIVCGTMWTKWIVSALVVLSVAALGWLIITYFHLPNDGSITIRYFLFGIVAPSICLLVLLWSKNCQALKHAATLAKFIMAIGVLYSLVYYYLLAKTYGLVFLGLFQAL
jgi:4-hydroxybenzoate polyprenyltransferase